MNMKTVILLCAAYAAVTAGSVGHAAARHEGHGTRVVSAAATVGEKELPLLGKPGTKQSLGDSHYVVFSFDKPPKMGTRIVKVEIFTKDGKKDTGFDVKGGVDMPSMRGAHASGPQPFKLSKKGDYLLPVSLVMPGDWELTLTFSRNGRLVGGGRYPFSI